MNQKILLISSKELLRKKKKILLNGSILKLRICGGRRNSARKYL